MAVSLSHQDNKIKEEKAHGACIRHGRGKKSIQNFSRRRNGYRHRRILFDGIKTYVKGVDSVGVYYISVVQTEHLLYPCRQD